jgi:hypothetical protein
MIEDTKVSSTSDGEDLISIVYVVVIVLKWLNFVQYCMQHNIQILEIPIIIIKNFFFQINLGKLSCRMKWKEHNLGPCDMGFKTKLHMIMNIW